MRLNAIQLQWALPSIRCSGGLGASGAHRSGSITCGITSLPIIGTYTRPLGPLDQGRAVPGHVSAFASTARRCLLSAVAVPAPR